MGADEQSRPVDVAAVEAKFADLAGPMGGCSIPDTAKRAMSLDQLRQLFTHVEKRMEGGEAWDIKRFRDGKMAAAAGGHRFATDQGLQDSR